MPEGIDSNIQNNTEKNVGEQATNPTKDFAFPSAMGPVIDLALLAGAKHKERLSTLRDALLAGLDPQHIVSIAREACGLQQDDCCAQRNKRC